MKRIENHPILGPIPKREKVYFQYEGQTIEGYLGETIATALIAHGVKVFRYTRKMNLPRGIFCAIGRCTDCVMTVDSIPNIKTCVTPIRNGMIVEQQKGLGHRRKTYEH
jgi:hypothetical protein